jgi:hypothetical protein
MPAPRATLDSSGYRALLRGERMGQRQKYLKRTPVTAVQINLETAGFTYEKWGSAQRCSAGDWLVNSGSDTYTVQRDSFEKTYKKLDTGQYRKTTPVCAEVATESGQVRTKEGLTRYEPGDYLVSNDEQGHDQYAISKKVFHETYEPVYD